MSGHSKFTSIKHKKERNDAAKGETFTVIGREIAVTVKEDGPDPANNSKPRDVIVKAKASNILDDTINNGIERAADGLDNVNYEQNVYEGYGPSGVAIIVEILTDNKNRMATNMCAAFSEGGGNVSMPGCVSSMSDRKGQIIIDKGRCETDPDELMMFALDVGMEDFADNENSYEVLTDSEQLLAVREVFEQKGIPILEADVRMIPQNWVSLKSEEDQKKIQHILDLLGEDDDVQVVFHSWDEE